MVLEHIILHFSLLLVSLLLYPLLIERLLEKLPHSFLFHAVALMGSFPRSRILARILNYSQIVAVMRL